MCCTCLKVLGASSSPRLRIQTDAGKSYGLWQEVGAGLVVSPHTRADTQGLGGLRLGHPMRAAPCPQPRRALFEREAPEGIGGNLHVVRPMHTPAPLADLDPAECVVVRTQRCEDCVLRKVARDIDHTLRATFPRDQEAPALGGLDGPEVRRIGIHSHLLRLRRSHSDRNNSIFIPAQVSASRDRRTSPALTTMVSISMIARKPAPRHGNAPAYGHLRRSISCNRRSDGWSATEISYR